MKRLLCGIVQMTLVGLLGGLPRLGHAEFEVYFLRHGQTDWNLEHRLQGSVPNTKLTEEGRAIAVATRFGLGDAGIRFDRVYTSPYDRARETADILAEGNRPIVDLRLREMCFGKYEGMKYGKGSYPDDNLRLLFEDSDRYVPQGDGAESFDQVQARLRDFLENELRPLDGKVKRVLCVAHSLVLRSLVRELAGTDAVAAARKTLQPNCCSHVIRYSDGKFSLVETGKVFYDTEKLNETNAFTVATYNVRYDAKEDGPDLSWKSRLPRIVKVVRNGKFDLVGFQEVTRRMFPTLVEAFPEYSLVGRASDDCPVPIAYRPDMFELIDSGLFSMSENPENLKFVSWGASSARLCQWALLRQKASGRKMRVFNMHPDWKSAEARANGMRVSLLRASAAMAFGEEVILLGDMNEMDGRKPPADRYDPRYPMGTSISMVRGVLRDSYDVTEKPHAGPSLTAHWYRPRPSERLDYIFVSSGFRVLRHCTLDDRPGGQYPSDHDPVSAVVLFAHQ